MTSQYQYYIAQALVVTLQNVEKSKVLYMGKCS